MIALGLLGDLGRRGIPSLIASSTTTLSEPAAVALNTITGRSCMRSVRARTSSTRMNFLTRNAKRSRRRDVTDPQRRTFTATGSAGPFWTGTLASWLEANKHRFSRQHRWRMGRPHGPAALVECLKSETNPFAVRAATYEELVVRFGLDVPFEVDLPVFQQRRFLARIEDWASRQSDKFEEGRWYFAADLQS